MNKLLVQIAFALFVMGCSEPEKVSDTELIIEDEPTVIGTWKFLKEVYTNIQTGEISEHNARPTWAGSICFGAMEITNDSIHNLSYPIFVANSTGYRLDGDSIFYTWRGERRAKTLALNGDTLEFTQLTDYGFEKKEIYLRRNLDADTLSLLHDSIVNWNQLYGTWNFEELRYEERQPTKPDHFWAEDALHITADRRGEFYFTQQDTLVYWAHWSYYAKFLFDQITSDDRSNECSIRLKPICDECEGIVLIYSKDDLNFE